MLGVLQYQRETSLVTNSSMPATKKTVLNMALIHERGLSLILVLLRSSLRTWKN